MIVIFTKSLHDLIHLYFASDEHVDKTGLSTVSPLEVIFP